METEARLIKRYANRKLYDTQESRYVTLQQIATYVRDGEEVRIVDNKTKEDLTNVTLAQIIYEEEKQGEADARSVRSLRDFIQDGRARLTSLLDKGKREDEDGEGAAADDTAQAASDEGEAVGPLRTLVQAPKEALDEWQKAMDERMRGLFDGALGTVQQLQGEVGRLQARIEELEGKLAVLARRPKEGESDEEIVQNSDTDAE